MKNKRITLSIMIGTIAIVLIATSILLTTLKSKEKETDKDDSFNNNSSTIVNNATIYECRLKLESETTEITSYQIEELSVLDGTVLQGKHFVELNVSEEEKYLSLKNDEQYSQGKNFNDEKRSITFSSGDVTDYTKDATGEKMVLTYDTYQKSLEDVGYTCSQK